MADSRVIVVGAGPAGVRAAEALVEAGMRPIVVDEAERAGGQIYRRPPMNFARSHAAIYGADAGKAKALHDGFESLCARIDYRPWITVSATPLELDESPSRGDAKHAEKT